MLQPFLCLVQSLLTCGLVNFQHAGQGTLRGLPATPHLAVIGGYLSFINLHKAVIFKKKFYGFISKGEASAGIIWLAISVGRIDIAEGFFKNLALYLMECNTS